MLVCWNENQQSAVTCERWLYGVVWVWGASGVGARRSWLEWVIAFLKFRRNGFFQLCYSGSFIQFSVACYQLRNQHWQVLFNEKDKSHHHMPFWCAYKTLFKFNIIREIRNAKYETWNIVSCVIYLCHNELL